MRSVVVLFFAAYLLAGVAVHGDYGVSWDEQYDRELGQRTLGYVSARVRGEPVQWEVVSKGLISESGPLFQTFLAALEAGLGLEDSSSALKMRHLVTFLAFWLGTASFYALLRMRFDDRGIALAGAALMALTPRLFAHSFYNPKDAVLASLFMAGVWTMLRLAKERSWTTILCHALVSAAAVGIRLVGVLLPAVTLVVVGLGFLAADRRERNLTHTLAAVGAYLLAFALLVVLFWPALWEHPVLTFLDRARGLAAAPQVEMQNNFSLYMGNFVRVDQLPWHYLPVWMLLTIPLPTVLLFATGIWAIGKSLFHASLLERENVQNIAFSLLLFMPLLAVVVLRPVLYDDWRHLYFVYPAFLVIAMTGLRELCTSPALRKPALALVLVAVVHGVVTIVRYHPYQNVYFNTLAGGDVGSRYELDYWGLSYREGLEYVLRTDPKDSIRVGVSDYPGRLNAQILDPQQRQRLNFVPVEQAEWYLSTHRQPARFAEFRARRFPFVNELYAVRVEGATLLGVYKLP